MPPTPPTTRTNGSSTDAAISKIIGLLQSLHDKVDAISKCECSSLRQEINEVKASLANTVQVIPSQPPPESTYAAVKQALTDATNYADKAKRAVWVGLQEGTTTEETTANDQKAIESLCSELNDPIISAALTEGSIKHHRHPEKKGERHKRILKIEFPSQKIRDQFLSNVRSSRPPTVTKQAGNYIRRDLCPFELDLERKARSEAFELNRKMGGLVYGIRDEKLIKFNGTPRPLPVGYETRPPRGHTISNDSSNSTMLNQSSVNHESVLSSLTPMQPQSNRRAAATTSSTGAGAKA